MIADLDLKAELFGIKTDESMSMCICCENNSMHKNNPCQKGKMGCLTWRTIYDNL